jgi:hypothetical protein
MGEESNEDEEPNTEPGTRKGVIGMLLIKYDLDELNSMKSYNKDLGGKSADCIDPGVAS